jgi:hypothetical protein
MKRRSSSAVILPSIGGSFFSDIERKAGLVLRPDRDQVQWTKLVRGDLRPELITTVIHHHADDTHRGGLSVGGLEVGGGEAVFGATRAETTCGRDVLAAGDGVQNRHLARLVLLATPSLERRW